MGDKLNRPTEKFFESFCEVDEVIERLFGRIKLDDNIHVTAHVLLPTNIRSEQPKSTHTQLAKALPVLPKDIQNILFCERGDTHNFLKREDEMRGT